MGALKIEGSDIIPLLKEYGPFGRQPVYFLKSNECVKGCHGLESKGRTNVLSQQRTLMAIPGETPVAPGTCMWAPTATAAAAPFNIPTAITTTTTITTNTSSTTTNTTTTIATPTTTTNGSHERILY